MHAVSQIIERNLHRRGACASGLWINPEQDSCWQLATNDCGSLKLFSQDHGAYHYLKQSGADVEFSAFPQAPRHKYQWIMLNLPREKALLHMLLDCATELLAEEGVLWLAGENRAGIKSADKLLKSYFGQVRKLDNARHCSLYEARSRLSRQSFNPLSYHREWMLEGKQTQLKVISYPGVFAHGRLDAGTALLLDALTDIRLEGDVLDFACGAGVIGACIAARHPHTRLTLLDTNALALRACRETLEANHLKGTVLASDGLSSLEGSFDFIISNPPIHNGVKTDNQMSIRLLASVHDHINPGGSLVTVANRHLPYENWLRDAFNSCHQLRINDHYKILIATR